MPADLVPLFGLLAAAVAIYVVRERRRRRYQIRPPRPDISIEEAWAAWLAGASAAAAPSGVLEDLRAVAERAAASGRPRIAVRRAILENAGMVLHLEAIEALGETERAALLKGYEPGMGPLLRETRDACASKWAALRHYTRLKYDDAVPGDWFDHFVHLARPYIREKVRLARDFLLEIDPAAGKFAEVYDKLLEELARAAVDAPPKKRFPPPDLP